jgi:hypothetical protein
MKTESILCGTLFPWEEGFPRGYGHTSVAYLKRCEGFERAKNGDMNAADSVVQQCVKYKRIHELQSEYPNSVLLPVIGRNALPLAFAQALNMPVWKNVLLTDPLPRKKLFAIQRLLHKPVFVGFVQKDTEYIIVDDVITQGGTIATLREYVLARGGRVVAVSALAFSVGSHYIAPTKDVLLRLFAKFGYPIGILQAMGFVGSLEELTYSQVRYLLRFSSVRNICNKMEQANFMLASDEKNKSVRNLLIAVANGRNEAELANEVSYSESQSDLQKRWRALTNYQQKQLLPELIKNMN